MSDSPTPVTFADFALRPELKQGLADMGYTHPTPVQALSVPQVLQGGDWVVQAKTGSGKTLAFGLPTLNNMDGHSPDVQVLAICPTRELAIQVADEIRRVGTHMGVITTAVYGGSKMEPQIEALKWSSVVVGTPGRLRDHLERGTLRLDACQVVVLDEADEMLDMGFKKDLEFILGAIANPNRRTLLFSATFPPAIEQIAKRYMKDAQKIAVSSGLTTPTDISHKFVRVSSPDARVDALAALIDREEPQMAIIFCKTKLETSWLARRLNQRGYKVGYMNGDMTQDQRLATLARFKSGDLHLIAATDVAARGLDIQGVSHVINYTVPSDTETYVHRSGRTGRAGRKGICYTLVIPEQEEDFARIQRDLKKGAAQNDAASAEPTSVGGRREPKVERQAEGRGEARGPKVERRGEARQPARERHDRAGEPKPTTEARGHREQEPKAMDRAPAAASEAEALLAGAPAGWEGFRQQAARLLRQADAADLLAALLAERAARGPRTADLPAVPAPVAVEPEVRRTASPRRRAAR